MNNRESQIEQLLSKSNDELLSEIGLAFAEQGFGAIPSDKKSLRSHGVTWFNLNIDEIKNTICNLNVVQQHILDDKSNKAEIISLMADELLKKWVDFPVLTLATLLFKEGLNNICHA